MKTTLVMGIILLVCMLILEFVTKKMSKKKRWISKFILVAVFAVFITVHAIKSNPPVYAVVKENTIEFKVDETVDISSIDSIEYFENTEIELVSNGFRWGNSQYYSGDANIRFLDENGSEKEYAYKCKAYLNGRSKDYIWITLKDSSKSYVFNYDDEDETKKVYEQIKEKLDNYNN